jgi:hypothetical protein
MLEPMDPERLIQLLDERINEAHNLHWHKLWSSASSTVESMLRRIRELEAEIDRLRGKEPDGA